MRVHAFDNLYPGSGGHQCRSRKLAKPRRRIFEERQEALPAGLLHSQILPTLQIIGFHHGM